MSVLVGGVRDWFGMRREGERLLSRTRPLQCRALQTCTAYYLRCSCDADPAALSKYVVALLRKEKPKAALKELCIDQLEVFLAKGRLGTTGM